MHAIAVQHLVHLARRQEEIVAAGIGNQETEPVRMALDRAGDEIELGDDAKLALAVDEQLAVALERGDACVEAVLLLAAHAESRRDLGGRERRARLAEFAQDGFRTQCEGGETSPALLRGFGARGSVAARRRMGIVFDKDRCCF